MFSRVNNTSQNIITTATTQEYGRIYLYMYTAAITGHHTLDVKSIDINSTMKRQRKLNFFHYEIKYKIQLDRKLKV